MPGFTRRTAIRTAATVSGAALLTTGGAVAANAAPARSAATIADPASSPDRLSGVPVPPGRIEAAVAALDGIIEDIMRKSTVPGMAVAVVRDGQVVHADGYGVKKVGTTAGVDKHTVFQLASVSKPLTGTLVAREVTLGRVGWHSRIQRYLPWFQLADPWVSAHLTVADCLSHRSGLGDQSGDDLEDLGWSRTQVLRRLRYLPLDEFRASYHYTNWGYTAGGEAVAVAAGTSFENLARRDLFAPLGMTSSSFRFADFISASNRVTPHAWVDGRYQALYQRQPDPQAPAGGASSTVLDLAKWMAMILADGKLPGHTDHFLSEDALFPALTPHMPLRPKSALDARVAAYGHGFNVSDQPSGRVQYSHSGAFVLGTGTAVSLLPSLGLGIVTLTNGAPLGAAESVNAEFMDLAQFGEQTFDWWTGYHNGLAAIVAPFGSLVGKQPPAHPAPARAARVYQGTYDNPCYGPITVAQKGSGLVLQAGPRPISYPLTHWDGDTYFFRLALESAAPGSISKVTFGDVRGNKAHSVVVEVWNTENRGTFRR